MAAHTAAILLAVFALSSCGRVTPSRPPSTSEAAPSGRPSRIISLSPNVTEILYGIGVFDRVVAVSTFCDYPPETAKLPRVGTWQSTNLEQIQSLDPDLIAMTDAQAPFVRDQLEKLGYKTVVVRSQSLDDVYTAMLELGRATGVGAQAEDLEARTRAAVDDVRERARSLTRPRVLCVVDRVPGTLRDLYSSTAGSFLNELISAAGGEPLTPPSDANYAKISKEAVATLDPDVIIDMVQGQKGAYSEDPQAVWRELPELAAVKNGRVYPFRDTSVLHPSQFVATTVLQFAQKIHPEAFPSDDAAPKQ